MLHPYFAAATVKYILIIAISFAAVFANSLFGQETRRIEVEGVVSDWVMHEPTGRVFATLTQENTVIEFDSTPKEVRRFPVKVAPRELLIKGNLLVVGCTRSPLLQVIDLDSNEIKGEIALSGQGPNSLFCSAVDNNLVYCVCNTGNSWWDGEVFQCDLKTMKIRKQVKVSGWGQSHVTHVAMSRDGKWIVPDARGASSPSGADLMKVDEEQATFTQIRDYHDSFGQIVAAPSNRFWTFGPSLYTLDITQMVRTFAGSPVAIHPTLDLVVSKTEQSIVIEKFSDASSIDSIGLGASESDQGRASFSEAPFSSAFDPTIQFDITQQLAFVGTQTKAFWIDLKAYADKTTELQIILAPSDVKTIVGKEVRIPVTTTSPRDNAVVSIVSGPAQAKIEDGQIVWLPKPQDVGLAAIELELKAKGEDKAIDNYRINVEVTSPNVEIGFIARAIEISPAMKYAVVWGASPGQEERHPAHTGSDDIAVVDVHEAKIVARKTIPQGIRSATLDDQFIFVAPQSGNLIYRLDLKLGEGQKVFTQSAPKHLARIGEKYLLSIADTSQVFDAATLKPMDKSTLGLGTPGYQPILVNAEAVLIGNRIIDRKTGEVIRCQGFADLPAVTNIQSVTQRLLMQGQGNSHSAWGRRLGPNSLLSSEGSPITTWNGFKLVAFSERWPLAVSMDRAPDAKVTKIDFLDLMEGNVVHTAVIYAGASPPNVRAMFNGIPQPLVVRDDKIFCLIQQRLLFVDIPSEIASQLTIPTHFANSKVEVIDAEQTAKWKPAVKGTNKDVTFSLLAEYPGLALDSQSGELTLDTPLLWKSFLENYTRLGLVNFNFAENRGGTPDTATIFAPIATRYKLITGNELPKDKIAVQIPISLALQTSDGQRDTTEFSIIALGPIETLEKAVSEQKAEQARLMANAREAQQRMIQDQQAKRAQMEAGEKAAPNNANERLDALENRMRRLEAALDSILKRLDEDKQQ